VWGGSWTSGRAVRGCVCVPECALGEGGGGDKGRGCRCCWFSSGSAGGLTAAAPVTAAAAAAAAAAQTQLSACASGSIRASTACCTLGSSTINIIYIYVCMYVCMYACMYIPIITSISHVHATHLGDMSRRGSARHTAHSFFRTIIDQSNITRCSVLG
jgi:hypothetical protein